MKVKTHISILTRVSFEVSHLVLMIELFEPIGWPEDKIYEVLDEFYEF